jgi:nucleoside-diphosphate kinase
MPEFKVTLRYSDGREKTYERNASNVYMAAVAASQAYPHGEVVNVEPHVSEDSHRIGISATLAIIKPDAMQHVHEILNIIISHNDEFSIFATKIVMLDPMQAAAFYFQHARKEFFDKLVGFMSSGPVMAIVLNGKGNVVRRWREIIGDTDPRDASNGTIRAKFGSVMPRNAVHGSSSIVEAGREIRFFFAEMELFSLDI